MGHGSSMSGEHVSKSDGLTHRRTSGSTSGPFGDLRLTCEAEPPPRLRAFGWLPSIRNPSKRFLVWLLIALLGGIATAHAQPSSDETSAGTIPPTQLAAQVTAVADATVSQWVDHELNNGSLGDPVLGPVTGS